MNKRSSNTSKTYTYLKSIMTRKKLIDATDFLSKLVVIIGLPLAIIQYKSSTQKETKDREYEVYNSLDERFIEWEKLCLAYPHLDIFDIKDSVSVILDVKQQKEEVILFTILFSLFERAYVLYSDQSTSLKKVQWAGWDEYIISYCKRTNFRKAWKISGSTYESGFQNYMEENIKKVEKEII